MVEHIVLGEAMARRFAKREKAMDHTLTKLAGFDRAAAERVVDGMAAWSRQQGCALADEAGARLTIRQGGGAQVARDVADYCASRGVR